MTLADLSLFFSYFLLTNGHAILEQQFTLEFSKLDEIDRIYRNRIEILSIQIPFRF